MAEAFRLPAGLLALLVLTDFFAADLRLLTAPLASVTLAVLLLAEVLAGAFLRVSESPFADVR